MKKYVSASTDAYVSIDAVLAVLRKHHDFVKSQLYKAIQTQDDDKYIGYQFALDELNKVERDIRSL